MGARERILTLRLMEKLKKLPDHGSALGVEVLYDKLPAEPEKDEWEA